MDNIQSLTVTYTIQEIQALTRLLDVAAKAGGLSVAGDVAVLHAKHLAAAQEATLANTPSPDLSYTPNPEAKDN